MWEASEADLEHGKAAPLPEAGEGDTEASTTGASTRSFSERSLIKENMISM
jgi:hypothetical protein